jgi:tRNA pseudouridine32 synthase/23S rRNA pseudouridine746 synthase
LSSLFQQQQIIKGYTARVRGNPAESAPAGKIDFKLDGRPAVTEFRVDDYDPATHTSMVRIIIATGRKHQIRRHFEMIGHPVMGDPRYGRDNKNSTGLQLAATGLEFQCPFKQEKLVFDTAAEF